MKYYLFRHGATRASTTDNVYHGEEIITAEILESGKPAIKRMAKYLDGKDISMYCTSPFKRCIQTMDLIKEKTGKTFYIDDRLGEFMEDRGESFEIFGQRMQSFLKSLELKKKESVAVCTHGAGLSALKHYITEGNYKYENLMDFPDSGILWVIENKKLQEINFDD
jgi:broad specificity phosphatase PhoE